MVFIFGFFEAPMSRLSRKFRFLSVRQEGGLILEEFLCTSRNLDISFIERRFDH